VRSGHAPRCRPKRGGSDHPSSPGLSARRGRRAARFRPRRRSRLQAWTARSPPRFPSRRPITRKWFICAHRGCTYLPAH